ncbi:hypothetical protein [Nitratifractor sp.]
MANGKNRFLDIAVKRDAEPKNRFLDIAVKSDNSRIDTMPVEDYAEAIDNKSGTIGSFFKGFTHTFDEYAATLNKGLDWAADKIAGRDTHYFDQNVDYWNRQRKQNEIETADHPFAHLAGELLLDPINFTPAGIASKGTKLARIAKSAAGGAAIGAGATFAHDYGNVSVNDEQKIKNMEFGAGLVALANAAIAALTRGKVRDAIKTPEDIESPHAKAAIQALIERPEAFGLDKGSVEKIKREAAAKEQSAKSDEAFDWARFAEDYAEPDHGTVLDAEGNVLYSGEGAWRELHTIDEPHELRAHEQESDPTPEPDMDVDAILSAPIENLSDNPLFQYVVDRARKRSASDIRHGRRLEFDRDFRYTHDGAKWGAEISPAVYSPNYEADFALTKGDVKKIEAGKITPEIEEKIRHDMRVMLEHPDWADEGTAILSGKRGAPLDEVRLNENGELVGPDGVPIFANGIPSLAVGVGAGTYNAISGEYDPNRDFMSQIEQKFLQGLIYGTLGTLALKQLRHIAPESYERVRKAVLENSYRDADGSIRLNANALESKYLRRGRGGERVNEPALMREAAPLPEPIKSYQEFKANFLSAPDGRTYIETPVGRVYANAMKVWGHLTDNTHFDDRGYISGAFADTMRDPLFVVKQPYKDDWNIVFYKPFKGEDGHYHIAAFAVDRNGELVNKTFFELSDLSKLKKMIKVPDRNLLYEKRLNQPTPEGSPDYTSHAKSSVEKDANAIVADDDSGVKIGMFAGDKPYTRPSGPDDFKFEKAVVRHAKEWAHELNPFSKSDTSAHLKRIIDDQFSREWKKIDNSLKGSFNRWFRNTLSGEYMSKREEVMSGRHEAIKEAEKLHAALMHLSESDRKMLHEYIVGDIDDAPEHVKAIAENIRATVHDLQEKIRDAGILPDEAIDAWGKYYLKRLYDPYYNADNPVQWVKRSMTIPKMKRRGKEEIVTMDEFRQMVEDGEIPTENLTIDPESGELVPTRALSLKDGGVEIDFIGKNRVRIRRDWTKEEREAMGEITDAAITVPETVLHLKLLLEHSKFLDAVARVDGSVVLPDEAAKLGKDWLKANGYTKLGSDPRYGPLAGQWVRDDVANDIKGVSEINFGKDGDALIHLWRRYLALWKKSKTVWNATTHLNNLVSNFFLMHLAGLGWKDIGQRFVQAAAEMKAGSRLDDLEKKAAINALSESERAELARLSEELKYYKEASRMGLLNTSFVEDIAAGEGKGAHFGVRSKLGELDKRLSNLYQTEDAVNKLAMYRHLREQGWSPSEARRGVEAIMPDYSAPMAKGIKAARDTGVTPFIAWAYFTYPKILSMLKTKRGMIQAGKVIGTFYGLSYLLTGIGNPYSNALPDDAKAKRVPVWRDGNKITTVKMDRLVPYMQFMSPLSTGAEFIGQGIPQAVLSNVVGTKIYNSRPVTSTTKPAGQQLYDKAKYFVQSLTPIPQQVNSGWDFIESLLRSENNRKRSSDIVPRTPAQQIIKLFPGINILTYDEERVRKRNKRQNTVSSFLGDLLGY